MLAIWAFCISLAILSFSEEFGPVFRKAIAYYAIPYSSAPSFAAKTESNFASVGESSATDFVVFELHGISSVAKIKGIMYFTFLFLDFKYS
jgi:hypothetical protein